jgi:hypothetical protein
LVVLALGLLNGCQKQDDHPPYVGNCDSRCVPPPGITIGSPSSSGGSSSIPISDAGPGTLTGQVFQLNDESFVRTALYTSAATVTADGANGSPVTGQWDGADNYAIDDVARVATNWVSVKPNAAAGDAQTTYQAVQTNLVDTVNLSLVSGSTLDAVFNAVSLPRSDNFGQVVLFFRSAGTGTALAGLHVAMITAELAAYRTGTTWVADDGTATTDQSGLVVFGNVDPANSAGTQSVSVVRAASGSSGAVNAGTFAVRVVEGAVTIATVNVQL